MADALMAMVYPKRNIPILQHIAAGNSRTRRNSGSLGFTCQRAATISRRSFDILDAVVLLGHVLDNTITGNGRED